MNDSVTVSVYEVVGSPYCVASGDGEKVFERLEAALRRNRNVSLSFRNVSDLTSAFLNAAVGQLYDSYKEEQIRELLSVEDMTPEDMELLKRVVETAKKYFKDPKEFDAAVREALGESEDGE